MKRPQRTDDRAQDLDEYSSEFVEPIPLPIAIDASTSCRPTCGHRGTGDAEIMENFLWGRRIGAFGSDESAARHDRGKKAGVRGSCEIHRRPEGTEIAVATLLSKEWAAHRAKLIDADKANCDAAAGEYWLGRIRRT